MQFEGWFSHDRGVPSLAYRSRNPGNLEVGGVKRTYQSLVDGYADLLRDLRGKFTGNNSHGLGPESTMLDLFATYAPVSDSNPTVTYCYFVCGWVTIAIGKPVVPGTKLKEVWSGGNVS